MDQNPKPVLKNSEKNIFCPYYKNCLNHAAKHHWKNWDCSECRYKLTQKTIKTEQITSDFYPHCELHLKTHITIQENLI